MRRTPSPLTFSYGPSPSQKCELHLPEVPKPAVVCLLHGGFWRMPYGRDQWSAVAEDLVARGYAVWNCGYRRVGEPGGGWPGSLQDVAAAIDRLAEIGASGIQLDLEWVTVVGHSAGGQLALCVASRDLRAGPFAPRRIRPAAVAGLAAATDLARIWALGSGNGSVAVFLGGSPDEHPERYAMASPLERLPLGTPQLVLHGARDEALPVELSRAYAAAAQACGDSVDYIELPEGSHFEFLDPGSQAHEVLCGWLEQTIAARPRSLQTRIEG